MNADFIVHYGKACMSKTTRLPVLYVFGKKKIDVAHLSRAICGEFKPEDKLIVMYDVGYQYAMRDLEKLIQQEKREQVVFAQVDREKREVKRTSTIPPRAGCSKEGNSQCCRNSSAGSGCEGHECAENENRGDGSEASQCIEGSCCSPVHTSPANSTETNTTNTTTTNTNTTDINTGTDTNSPNTTNTTTNTPNTININGRDILLLPGTSLQEYSFLCIFCLTCSSRIRTRSDFFNKQDIGEEDNTVANLMMTNSKSQFFIYNPEVQELHKLSDVNKNLMRRYHYIEKAKDADIIGIVVATLGVEGYMEVITRMKTIIKEAGKKSYLIVVGKLNEFKLGNFQEIDIFVLVACTENTLIDSKNYYKPVITPFELEIALVRGREWTGEYRTDFEHILKDFEPPKKEDAREESAVRFSLNSQKLMKNPKHIDIELESSTDLTTRNNNLEMVTNAFATSYLASRSWRGLEQHIGETPVSAPVEGRSGIASVYEGEPK